MSRRIGALSLSLLFAAALPTAAHAGACEDSFQKSGNIISGLHFTATTTVPDLPPDVAINQMRAIVAKRGYDIIAIEPAGGEMQIEQPMSGQARAFPITVSATSSNGIGMVQMVAKLRSGMSTKTEAARAEMCSILAEVQGGKAGRLAAKGGAGATTAQAAPVAMSVLAFSSQISKDAERNAALIPQRYANKRFVLNGTIEGLDSYNGKNSFYFKVIQPSEMVIRLPGMASHLSKVGCFLAPGTSVFVSQLKNGKSVKIVGTFDEFDTITDVIWLKDCRPADK